jgi:SAM-dependent methyltransferase
MVHIVDSIVRAKVREFLNKHSLKLMRNTFIVLDIGCGKKPYKNYFKSCYYIGIDVSRDVEPDIVASAEALPFRSEWFDVILLTEVLEHVPEPTLVLSEARKALKKGGFIIITAPQYWFLHEEPRDFYRFTKYGIEYLLKKTNFQIIDYEHKGGRVLLIGTQFLLALSKYFPRRIHHLLALLFLSLDKKVFLPSDTLGWCFLAKKL